jgi:pimeloyl-ACP methyl ester carboxylesterase
MPYVSVNGTRLHYEDRGSGPRTIVFAHGLLWSGRMFDAQVAAFSDRYRCVTFDHRGQGQSELAPSGYDMDTLMEDAAALIQSLGCAPCHFAGLSMGGFIAMRLGARRPELLRSLILLETSADPETADNARRYKLGARLTRALGTRLGAPQVMATMFGRTFMTDPARAEERAEWQSRLAANRRVGVHRATLAVADRKGIYDEIAYITLPTLVIVGDEDVATPPALAKRIAHRIPGAQLVTIPRAGHTSPVEQPAAVNAAIGRFLSELG